ncbi:MAG: DUF448 domain-containing protein [Candidatus Cloacimonetes bacterium]|jgi:predicted RNA-binding protein YlxR (DUF448 family)|nr:DUF448 domain-containing protein [Candidatus Cloacimonadota bacterium]
MTNKASKANHIPQRQCVICKTKKEKNHMYRIVFINKQIIIDLNAQLNSYGYYICDLNNCLKKLFSWRNKKKLKTLDY